MNTKSIIFKTTPLAMLAGIVVFLLAVWLSAATTNAAINQQMNYQGRLLDSSGAVVADGSYNVRFKIYSGGDGVAGGGDETLEWTETREGSDKVSVTNGYFSVNLGSVTAFGNDVDWNEGTLWVGVEVGGTDTPDYTNGVLSPYKRLAATPYSLNSLLFNGLQSTAFLQIAQGVQTDSSTSNASIFINKTGGTADILTLQRAGSNVFNISNSGSTVFRTNTDATNGFQVNDADGGTPVFNVDTQNERVGIGTASPSSTLEVNGDINKFTLAEETLLGLIDINSLQGTESSVKLIFGDATPVGGVQFGGFDVGNDGSFSVVNGSTGAPVINATNDFIVLGSDTNVLGNGVSVTSPDSEQAQIAFGNSATRWEIGNQADNSFRIYDNTNTRDALNVQTDGDTVLNPSAGNTGVGTSTPGTKLDVNGTVRGARFSGNSGSTTYLSADNTNNGLFVTDAVNPQSGSTRAFHVTADGSPTEALRVTGGSASDNTLRVVAASSQSADIVLVENSGGTDLFTIQADGDIGVGESSPAAKLDVAGAIRLGADTSDNNLLNTTAGSATTADLYWGNDLLCDVSATDCGGGGGSGATNLQDAYDGGGSITLADGDDITITSADTTTDPNLVYNIQGGGRFSIQNNGTTSFQVRNTGQTVIGGGDPFLEWGVPGLSQLTINKDNGYAAQAFQVASATAAESGAFFAARSRGTVASPTESQSGDTLFQIAATGYTTNNLPANTSGTNASITFVQDAASTTTTAPTAISFRNSGSTEALRITSGGQLRVAQSTALTGDISPSQITASQNDYSPTDLSTATVLRLSSDNDDRAITGLSGGADGRIVVIYNTGTTDLVLEAESSSSTAANRFALDGREQIIPEAGSTMLIYDSTSSRWRRLGGHGATSPDFAGLRRQTPVYVEFLSSATTANPPFVGTAISSGTSPQSATSGGVSRNHQGVVRLLSSSTTNSGYRWMTDNTGMLLGGGEVFEAVFQPQIITNTTTRIGFHDATTSADAVDGAYIELPASSGAAVLKTANNSTRTTSSTIATLSQATWYRLRITVNRNAASVTAEIFDANGVSLGSQTNNTDIPTAVGRWTGAGLVSTSSNAAQTVLCEIDYMAIMLGQNQALLR